MQGVTEKELDELIEEAKKAGKDVSDLEAERSRVASAAPPPMAERKEKSLSGGAKRIIQSTGPAKEEDFK